jgi:hypothetical protein
MTPFIAFSYRLCVQAVHGLNGFLNDTNILARKADTRRAGRRVFFFPPFYELHSQSFDGKGNPAY